jgi:methylmalonyl-CoA/ethylmalonyl-CoA epimerase
MIKVQPSHIAVLVPSVRKAAHYLRQFNFHIGNEEEWEGEGTKEIYIEREKGNSLLLMEPIKDGAYKRAMNKRGPGIHHIAIDVTDIESFISEVAGSGWLLHPISLKTFKASQTIYLARPGVPALIEVQQREKLSMASSFITEIQIPNLDERQVKMFRDLGLAQIHSKAGCDLTLVAGGKEIHFKDLVKL